MNTNEAKVEFKVEFKVTIPCTISAEQMESIVSTALEGGITYWCDRASCNRNTSGLTYYSEELLAGGTLTLYYEEESVELTCEKLQAGLVLLGEKYPACLVRLVEETYDTEDADTLIQYAVFGALVYG